MPLLWVLMTVVEPGAGLDLPPQNDLFGRIIIGAAMILTPLMPFFVARISAKKSPSNAAGAPPIAVTAELARPRLDIGQEYLEKYVQRLEEDVKKTEAGYEKRLTVHEAKHDDLEQRYQATIEERAILKTRLTALEAENVEIRADNAELRAEIRALRGRINER